MDWLGGIDAHWIWLALGLVLAGMEILIPGVYLIWLAVAAFVTGLLTLAFDISLPFQVIDFVFISLIAAYSAHRFLKERPIESSDPLMNQRGARLVGQIARVTEAIEHGQGRIHYGDSDWIARGPDVDEGDRVRIVGTDGAILLVEPLKALPDGGSGGELSSDSGGDGAGD
ncbi:MAG TPA: NfeD family protein [Sphingomonadaceae bacterium]|nr:NfeD family protein [Sphingomonadaceae bacterium]